MNQLPKLDIKAIIGLGNPGAKYAQTRHNIGFQVLDVLAHTHYLTWNIKENAHITTLEKNGKKIILLKPQTFMNDSGKVIPSLIKQGIKAENILVVHDELDQPFGAIKVKIGGSARGHNGLRSIITAAGDQFARLRVGIGRPTNKEDVPQYVLEKFSEDPDKVEQLAQKAYETIEELLKL